MIIMGNCLAWQVFLLNSSDPNQYSYTVIPKNSICFLMEGEVLHSKHLDGLDDGSNDMYNPY